MIFPGIGSPLRSVIAAFYETSYLVEPGWGPAECGQALRQVLASDGICVGTSSSPDLDMVVDERIGVTILPSTTLMTAAPRQRIRKALSADGAAEVALVMAFVPRLRLARVDAPRNSKGQAGDQNKETSDGNKE